MAQAITVNALIALLQAAKAKGHGNKKILISDDDEGNGYHLMFFAVTDKTKEFFASPYMNLPCGVKRAELEDYVILG